MAYEIIFTSIVESKLETKLQVFINTLGHLTIKLESSKNESQIVCLDRKTAIKLGREIRKQVSFMEVENG